MKRILSQAFLVVGTAALALGLTPACTDNDMSIFIRHVQAPPTNRQNGQCIYMPDPTQPFRSEGTLDIAIHDNYTAMILVGSQMMKRSDQTNTRSESNRVHIEGAVVRVTDANGGQINSFTTVTSGFVDVSDGDNAAWGVTGVTAIDAPTGQKIANTVPGTGKLVIANIKVFGKTLGGVDVESGEFQYPIRVCSGCLIDFSTGHDPAVNGPNCNLPLGGAAGTTSTTTTQTIPCIAGQDESTPCQLCLEKPACRGEK